MSPSHNDSKAAWTNVPVSQTTRLEPARRVRHDWKCSLQHQGNQVLPEQSSAEIFSSSGLEWHHTDLQVVQPVCKVQSPHRTGPVLTNTWPRGQLWDQTHPQRWSPSWGWVNPQGFEWCQQSHGTVTDLHAYHLHHHIFMSLKAHQQSVNTDFTD